MRDDSAPAPGGTGLVDRFGRSIDYLRVSVIDRCNYRCSYCMGARMRFLPKAEVLSLAEIDRICSAFVDRGVRRLRLTGGEPLVRRNVLSLVRSLSRHLRSGALDEITLTTNGSLLARDAAALAAAGVRRINVSLDTLDPERFAALTRRGAIADVLAGIDAALAFGMRVKINAVVLRGVNDGEIERLMWYAHARDMDLALIEAMPLGAVETGRRDDFVPLSEVREALSRRFTLEDVADRTCGPARYVRVRETGGRVGFVTPMSHGFCASCNRLRLTCTGQLALCLGREAMVDLRGAVRESADDGPLHRAIDLALARKPRGHAFARATADRPAVGRFMSATGG
ncbi:GTP 3',8-cyclase MoaA [Azospirillum sp. ST 5-10]|uniref:GTP 3',8-cyclase MoaA n=1 Tax=unclassified Azospirillum TaxID=2630922 RepID=UPI003F4A7A07